MATYVIVGLVSALIAMGASVFVVTAVLTTIKTSLDVSLSQHKADLEAQTSALVERLRAEIQQRARESSPTAIYAQHPSTSEAVSTATANLARLQIAEQEAAHLRAECIAANAIQVRAEHIAASEEEVVRLRLIWRSVRGPILRLLWQNAALTIVRFRLVFPDWETDSGVPGYLIALFSGVFISGGLWLLGIIFSAPAGWAIIIAATTGTLVFGVLATLISQLTATVARSHMQKLRAEIDSRDKSLAEIGVQLDEATARDKALQNRWNLKRKYEMCCQQVEQLRAFFQNRTNQLLARNWRGLRGIDFERYLVEVFDALGFVVTTTPTTGDQGVDLIAMKGSIRWAIQAKGYTGSVGNDSVQQAYSGMAFHKCDRCAVITNSEFTRSAEELAHRVQCVLIDGTRLPDLISGRAIG